MKQDRDSVRELVFRRDRNKCVIPWCYKKPDDAHHLIERKLWDDRSENGGYLPDNLVSICEEHHKLAENNTILPCSLREFAGIKTVILPASFDSTKEYDKWGVELETPARVRIKYPHTPYLPFSPNADEKDVAESGYCNLQSLLNKPLVVSLKMDGSNIVMTRGYVAARNGFDATHVSFSMLKQLHNGFKHLIPEEIMLFGEWLYAKHSIHYTGDLKLHNPIQVFGAYNKRTHMWLSIVDLNKLMREIIVGFDKYHYILAGVRTPPGAVDIVRVLTGDATFTNEKALKEYLFRVGNAAVKMGHEGIVVRNAYAFHHSRWSQNIAKFVREGHVQTPKHWKDLPMVRNEFDKVYWNGRET